MHSGATGFGDAGFHQGFPGQPLRLPPVQASTDLNHSPCLLDERGKGTISNPIATNFCLSLKQARSCTICLLVLDCCFVLLVTKMGDVVWDNKHHDILGLGLQEQEMTPSEDAK